MIETRGEHLADAVNLAEKFSAFSDRWAPKIVATFNDSEIMVVRVKDEFVWHSHPDTDDFFLVVEGELDIELRDRTVKLRAGELFVVPKGIEHRPAARNGEAKVLIIEPRGTPNTGDARTAVAKASL
jgi:mannose-6-phosphate isomerase-like protein (cupin superfamily)